MKSFLAPLLRPGAPACALTNTRNNRTVARTLLTAFDSASRRRGLLGRNGLEDGSALIIAPSSAIHTFTMRFAIDVALVSKEGHVLKVCPDVQPRRIAAPGARSRSSSFRPAPSNAATRVLAISFRSLRPENQMAVDVL